MMQYPVAARSTTPAISQTVRSMYQRWVGTMYTPVRRGMALRYGTFSDRGITAG